MATSWMNVRLKEQAVKKLREYKAKHELADYSAAIKKAIDRAEKDEG